MAEVDCPGTTISVLSPEHAAMVAPPITVSSLPRTVPAEPDLAALAAVELGAEALRRAQRARSRANMPVERHRRSTR
jgi:hypothetical protein